MNDLTAPALTRRALLKGASAGAALLSLSMTVTGAFAQNATGKRLHGLSAFGDLKYAAGFQQFDYVNADAPKGGRFHMSIPTWLFNQNPQTFNTLNTFVLAGDAPPRMERCFDSLLTEALDEPDAIYCHLAEWVEIAADRNMFRFGLREAARFHDGSPTTADDVVFSFMALKADGHPALASSLRNLTEAVAIDAATVELRFDGKQSGRAILGAAGMPILSKAYYADKDFTAATLEMPLASGPVKVGRFEPGRFIEFERVADYWGADLPTARGLNNFDVYRIEFYAERIADFEAFKKGDIHWRSEATAQTWATGYNFPAVAEGKVLQREFPRELRPSMQAWALNQRRPRFADRRVREAINLCFDFEWTQEKIFYNAYERSQSLFENSDFKAEGPPSAEELALIDSLENPVPQGVRGVAPLQPVSDGSGRDRQLLRQASMLLRDAGYMQEGQFLAKDGETLALEILIQASVFERVLGGYVGNLRRIGIDASIRLVDPAQYSARLNDFDFDMMGIAVSFTATPSAEGLFEFFSTQSAESFGSSNFPGAADPVYDEILERLSQVENREELTIVLKVLDRVLRARLDWLPNWFASNHKVAYWDMFGFVEPKPDYGWPVEALWWYDEAKAAAIGRA